MSNIISRFCDFLSGMRVVRQKDNDCQGESIRAVEQQYAGMAGGMGVELSMTGTPLIDEVFLVVETDIAEPLVGDLFRRRFHTDSFPDEPRHFVAFALLGEKGVLPLGYVHYYIWKGCALCGGLVIDDRQYRRLPRPVRQVLRDQGGVAELLLRESFSRLPDDLIAIWGHVGDRQSEKVCLRVGFEKTNSQYILAVWKKNFSDSEKDKWVKKVDSIGGF